MLRGYLPVPTYSAHLIAHKGLARAVDDFLEAEREAVAENIAELAAPCAVPEECAALSPIARKGLSP